METTTFTLSGNFWIFIILSGLIIAFTIYSYYHTNPHISNAKKSILISLRSLALILLLFILFRPALEKFSSMVIQPGLAILIDNSISNGLKDTKYDRKLQVENLLQNLDFSKIKKNTKFYSFSSITKEISNFTPDSLNYSGQFTDFSQAFDKIRIDSKTNNYQAILLISDGNINSGSNPLYSLDNLSIPVFTVGIGDSTSPKDIAVTSIISNEIAFINSQLNIYVELTSSGYENESIALSLLIDDEIIETAELKVSEEQKNYNYQFNYTPTKEGIHRISVQVKSLQGEFTEKNNINYSSVKVIKNKRVISIFAASPSPDLSLMNQYLSTDKEVKINQFVQKNGPEFYIQPTQSLINETQLFILLGFPSKQTPEDILQLIALELAKGKPVLFIAGNLIDYNKFSKLSAYLPFDVISSSNREFSAWVNPSENAASNPLLRIEGVAEPNILWENLPPVYKTETFVNPKIESTVLATSKIENVKFNEPMILCRESQGMRSIAVMAYSLFRWKISGYAKELVKGNKGQIDLFNIFFDNSIRWLSVSNVEKQLIVKTNKKYYSTSEMIEFKGNLWDNSLNPIENAEITIKIKKKNFDKVYDLPSLGNGVYFKNFPPLPKGEYNFFAIARVNNREIATEEGGFSVGAENFEYINFALNKRFLESISENSGGEYFSPEMYKQIPDNIYKLRNFTPSTRTLKTKFEFWNHWILLVLSILFLSTEWFIRKRLSML
jgi:hypothetical protein